LVSHTWVNEEASNCENSDQEVNAWNHLQTADRVVRDRVAPEDEAFCFKIAYLAISDDVDPV
jgi:hypothetical protein